MAERVDWRSWLFGASPVPANLRELVAVSFEQVEDALVAEITLLEERLDEGAIAREILTKRIAALLVERDDADRASQRHLELRRQAEGQCTRAQQEREKLVHEVDRLRRELESTREVVAAERDPEALKVQFHDDVDRFARGHVDHLTRVIYEAAKRRGSRVLIRPGKAPHSYEAVLVDARGEPVPLMEET